MAGSAVVSRKQEEDVMVGTTEEFTQRRREMTALGPREEPEFVTSPLLA